jgi:hypothetical protein
LPRPSAPAATEIDRPSREAMSETVSLDTASNASPDFFDLQAMEWRF